MRIIWCVAVLLGLVAAAPSASAWDRGDADVLTVLPNTSSGQPSSVEGLTVGPDGNIYVPTFGFNATGALTDNATLYVLKPNGKVLRQVTIANSSPTCSDCASIPSTDSCWCLISAPARSCMSTR
jgi:hypothetical protein